MRKIISVFLVLCMLLTLCGCAVQKAPESNRTNKETTTPDEATDKSDAESNTLSTKATESNTGNKKPQSGTQTGNNSTVAQKPTVQMPTVIYQKINCDKSGYSNKASIDAVNINGNMLYITYTILEHNGGGYDNFATDAVFYDDDNNILRILQVMYTTDINTFIGQQFVDDVAIPKGTAKILINSATENTVPLVSANHGNPNITLIVPEVCYDKNNYGNRVTIHSYNVYDNQFFIAYTPDHYYGGGYTSFAAQALFYNANGAIIKTSQLLYATNLGKALHYPCFSYVHIPEGTVKIEIRSGAAPATGGNGNSGSSENTGNTQPSTPSQPENLWTKAEATTLDNYVKNAVSCLNNAQSAYSSGRVYYPVANQYGLQAAGYIEKAIELLKKEPPVNLSDGTTLLSHFETVYTQLTKMKGISVTMDNADQYADTIWEVCYNGATDVAALRIYTAKLLSQF